jgi:hypothetical protein
MIFLLGVIVGMLAALILQVSVIYNELKERNKSTKQ